jgi:hypothetical protein
MASSSLGKNTYSDKILVNKLQANKIFANDILADKINADDVEANEIKDNDPSYLFSVASDNVTFTRTSTGGTLTFLKSEFGGKSGTIIQFTDRPLRQTEYITLDQFTDFFLPVLGDDNSFEIDPPNAVLVHNEEQRTYIVRLGRHDNVKVEFELELLPGETHNLNTVTGRMSFFVDNNGGKS